MKNIIHNLYLNAPFIVKRVLANIEAVRRDKYRRSSDVERIDFEKTMLKNTQYFDEERIGNFVNGVANNVEYYAFLKEMNIDSKIAFQQIPFLTKKEIRESREKFISDEIEDTKELWRGSSSGSTGMPLKYYRDKKSINIERQHYDAFYKYCGCDINEKCVRISGVKITHFGRRKPPYWLYIDKYKQLQCSAYHISKNTYKDYLKAFEKIGPAYATGFPSGWAALAELMLEDGVVYRGFKSIITDSEGLSEAQKKKIEKAFNCPVYQTYGLGEVGMCAVQCEKGHYHILDSHYVEVVNSDGQCVEDGVAGEIVVTDLNSDNYPFIRYGTGDMGIMYHDKCGCRMNSPYLTKIIGRIEDYILTKDGRKITRLTQLVKPAIGIKESQIIQESRDKIIINVVPNYNFDEESMKVVVEQAKEFVGDMDVSWEVVDRLERMSSGKLKFLIRKI